MRLFISKINAFISQNDQCALLWIMNASACLQYSFVKRKKKPAERLKQPEQSSGPVPHLSTSTPPPPPPLYTQLIKAPVGGDISLCITGVTVCPPGSLPGLTSPGLRSHSPGFHSLATTGEKKTAWFSTESLFQSLLPLAVPPIHCCGDIVSLNWACSDSSFMSPSCPEDNLLSSWKVAASLSLRAARPPPRLLPPNTFTNIWQFAGKFLTIGVLSVWHK